ncbi:Protein Red [Picochlorum sp. SENEW3]|nr:Protein Red [Picochlorum sp. SENEW3]
MDGTQQEAPPENGHSSAGLTNADFRKLLDTPRVNGSGNRQIKEKSKPVKRRGKAVHRQGTQEEEVTEPTDVSTYRDRAEERRRGVIDGGTSHLSDRDVATLSIEESKYFGGDEEHTHLVRGLDYALLSKVRAEREQRQREERRIKIEDELMKQVPPMPRKSTWEESVSHGHSALGRAILQALGQITRDRGGSTVDTFLPRRTGFAFSMSPTDKFEMPTVRMRALEDAPRTAACAENASLPKEVVDEIVSIMQYAQVGGAKSRRKESAMRVREPEQVQLEMAPAQEQKEKVEKDDDDDEDIFGDAGTDYVPEKRNEAKKSSGKAAGSYFSDTPQGEARTGDGTSGALVAEDATGANRGPPPEQWNINRQRMSRRQLEIDGYEECYPFEGGGIMDESDDEEGQVKLEKEAPQPDKRKELMREQAREKAKLDQELNRIQKIFDDKGYEHRSAFGGTSSKKDPSHPKADESFEPILKKKRRI